MKVTVSNFDGTTKTLEFASPVEAWEWLVSQEQFAAIWAGETRLLEAEYSDPDILMETLERLFEEPTPPQPKVEVKILTSDRVSWAEFAQQLADQINNGWKVAAEFCLVISDDNGYGIKLQEPLWLVRLERPAPPTPPAPTPATTILNFAHPLTEKQREQLAALLGRPVENVIEVKAHFDLMQDLAPQVVALVDGLGIAPEQWQREQWVVMLPSLNYAAGVMLAELHGKMGRFPAIVRLRAVPGLAVTEFEVAEVINLENVRQAGRE